MTSFNWISLQEALDIHQIQIELFGGSPGVRDPGGLESALARPQNLSSYGWPTLAQFAASYAFGICRNHPFVDGNKRTAYVVAATFLEDHDCRVIAPTSEIVPIFLALAAGEMTESDLSAWYVQKIFPAWS